MAILRQIKQIVFIIVILYSCHQVVACDDPGETLRKVSKSQQKTNFDAGDSDLRLSLRFLTSSLTRQKFSTAIPSHKDHHYRSFKIGLETAHTPDRLEFTYFSREPEYKKLFRKIIISAPPSPALYAIDSRDKKADESTLIRNASLKSTSVQTSLQFTDPKTQKEHQITVITITNHISIIDRIGDHFTLLF